MIDGKKQESSACGAEAKADEAETDGAQANISEAQPTDAEADAVASEAQPTDALTDAERDISAEEVEPDTAEAAEAVPTEVGAEDTEISAESEDGEV